MISLLEPLVRPWLRLIEPEHAHRLAVLALKLRPYVKLVADDRRLAVGAFGIDFPNPIGMAAGFDKHAEVPDALLRLGFGFVEVGTVTPAPQAGNPRPRVFRLERDGGVINRLGFNSEGADAVLRRLEARPRNQGIVGINIGANRSSADRIADYVKLIEQFAPLVSYFSVNISSPNTPGLRDLQLGEMLTDLLQRVMEARVRASGRAPALLLKIAPDLSLGELDGVVAAARAHRIDGMIVGNTTLLRPRTLRDRKLAEEPGGLSGRPLFALSTRMLAEAYIRVEGAFPLIGVGGIESGKSALAKIKAGASLIELYSALIFHGLRLLASIKAELVEELACGGHTRLDELVGRDAAAITQQPWPV